MSSLETSWRHRQKQQRAFGTELPEKSSDRICREAEGPGMPFGQNDERLHILVKLESCSLAKAMGASCRSHAGRSI